MSDLSMRLSQLGTYSTNGNTFTTEILLYYNFDGWHDNYSV